MDQHGSRFIQKTLETASLEEKLRLFPVIIPHARTLMTNVFGNYVIQKVRFSILSSKKFFRYPFSLLKVCYNIY